jgi:hypothetical protein
VNTPSKHMFLKSVVLNLFWLSNRQNSNGISLNTS